MDVDIIYYTYIYIYTYTYIHAYVYIHKLLWSDLLVYTAYLLGFGSRFRLVSISIVIYLGLSQKTSE